MNFNSTKKYEERDLLIYDLFYFLKKGDNNAKLTVVL